MSSWTYSAFNSQLFRNLSRMEVHVCTQYIQLILSKCFSVRYPVYALFKTDVGSNQSFSLGQNEMLSCYMARTKNRNVERYCMKMYGKTKKYESPLLRGHCRCCLAPNRWHVHNVCNASNFLCNTKMIFFLAKLNLQFRLCTPLCVTNRIVGKL